MLENEFVWPLATRPIYVWLKMKSTDLDIHKKIHGIIFQPVDGRAKRVAGVQMCIAVVEAYRETASTAIPKTSGVLQLDISS